MKKRRVAFACAIALLLSTCLPTPTGSRGLSQSRPRAGAPPRAGNVPALPPPPPARQLTEDLLTAFAKRITAGTDFSGAVIPGRLLNVRLILPPELSGAVVSGRRPLGVVFPGPATRGASTSPGGPASPAPVGGGALGPNVQFSGFELHLRWGVFESVNGRRGAELVESRDFQITPAGGLSRGFVMAPLRVAEYTGGTPPANPYLIVAFATVTALKTVPTLPPTRVTGAEVPLEVPLSLSALEVPKVFVLFLDKNFGGAAAIYLPKNQVFNGTQEQLFSGAGRLLDTYSTVASRLNFVTWFGSYITGLEALRAVGGLPHVSVKERKDSESNLNDDDFITRKKLTTRLNDVEVEDESSALLLLGPPGTRVQFFQGRGFGGGEFDVQTSNPGGQRVRPPADYAPGVIVRNFDAVTTSLPSGKVSLVRKFTIIVTGGFPGGPLSSTREVTPNDFLSSFKWGK